MSEETASLVTVLGWALIHFLWQGTLLGLATALALQWLRAARPQTRYALAYGSLSLCMALPAIAVCQGLFATALPAVPRISIDLLPSPSWPSGLQARWPWIVGAWALGSGLLVLRMTLGLAWVSRVRCTSEDATDRLWQAQLARMAARLGLRSPVALRLVTGLESPMAAGLWRPLVLVPAALLSRMPADLLEALLAHELAHLRRRDYLAHLVQSAIEALLFYHPAVWWITKQIRIEREQIADDLAAAAVGEPRRLAFALQELDLFQVSGARLAQAAHGGNLLARIQRLARPRPATPVMRRRLAVSLLGLALVCGVCCAVGPSFTGHELTAPDPPDPPAVVSDPAPLSRPAPLDKPDPPDL